MIAANHGHTCIMNHLKAYNANDGLFNSEGKRAEDFAQGGGFPEAIEILDYWQPRRWITRMSPMGEARWGEVRWGEGEQERPVIDAFTCRMQEDTHTTRTK